MRIKLRLASLLVALAGCGQPVLGVSVQLVTKACPGAAANGSRNPVLGVDTLTFTISGDGLTTTSSDVNFTTGVLQIPNLPVGTNRRIVVVACVAAAPAGGAARSCSTPGSRTRSRADSGLFDATGSAAVHLTLFLRVLDAFTATGNADGTTCTRMTTPRAGHALTLLPDGRVLVSGGFSLDSSSQLHYHDDAEIFDPATASFTAFMPAPSLRRSGHSALPVQMGTSGPGILLAGGEGPIDASGSGTAAPIKPFELFSGGLWSTVQLPAQTAAREHQAAAVDLKTGDALIVGGQSGSDAANGVSFFSDAAYFEPRSGAVHAISSPLRAGPLTDAVAVARANVKQGVSIGGVVLVGGRNASGASTQLSGLFFEDVSARDYLDDADYRHLALPRALVHHVAVRTRDDRVLVAGGLTVAPAVAGADYSNASSFVTLIDPAAQTVADLPGSQQLSLARADSCAAVLQDGGVLIIGGAWKDTANHSSTAVDFIGTDGSVRPLLGAGIPAGASWELHDARHRAACVRLNDGSVLVTGGLQFPAVGSAATVLDSAEIYMPIGAAK